MFGRLVRKELMDHLLDFRFLAVFALCVGLSALSMYAGGRNYARQLREYNATRASHLDALHRDIEKDNLSRLRGADGGYRWTRAPEALSSLVYGLSGKLGQEVAIQYRRPPRFEASLFETDPMHALFGVLDLAFVFKIVLSLAVLVFTYDAICGEKEGGTLRLYASFPVARSTLALAKLAGASIAVLAPFLFAYLLAAAVMALSPDLQLPGEDWVRMGVLAAVFGAYLVVFAAFGLCASALTHRRMTAFLSLLGLWTLWVFVAPDVAVRLARRMAPVESFVEVYKRGEKLYEEILRERDEDLQAYQRMHPPERMWQPLVAPPENLRSLSDEEKRAVLLQYRRTRRREWEALPKAEQQAIRDAQRKAYEEAMAAVYPKWEGAYYRRLARVQEERRNRMRQQYRLAMALSAISPFSAVTYLSMDLARTGFAQHERLEDALNAHFAYFGRFIESKQQARAERKRADLSDFSPFAYEDKEPLTACLARNTTHVLNLALLAVLGFVGAYVAILRYDVR